MNPPPHEVYIQIDDETEVTAFCLRRMETVTDTECQACFDAHEQLQTGYLQRFRCAELHWVEIAAFLPSSHKNPGLSPSDLLPSPSISHPSQKRHRRWT
jgi:hypothetical protein